MTLDQIKQYVDFIANKHESGRSCTEAEFNLLLEAVNIDLFNLEYSKLIQVSAEQNLPLNQVLYTSTALNEFKVYSTALAPVVGVATLPADFRYYMSIYGTTSTKVRDVAVVSDGEFNSVKNNLFADDLDEQPVAVIYNGSMSFIPNTITTVKLNYLKQPTTPYYDWCIKTDTNDIIYMQPGTFLGASVLNPGTSSLYSALGVEIENPVVNKDGSLVLVPDFSESVELEWNEMKHITFANMILAKMGINLSNPELYQIATIESNK